MHLTVNFSPEGESRRPSLSFSLSLIPSIVQEQINFNVNIKALMSHKLYKIWTYKSLACDLKILSRSSCPSIVVIVVVGCRCNRWIQHKWVSQLEIWKTSQSLDVSQSCSDVNSSSFDSLVSNVNGQYLRMKIKMLW